MPWHQDHGVSAGLTAQFIAIFTSRGIRLVATPRKTAVGARARRPAARCHGDQQQARIPLPRWPEARSGTRTVRREPPAALAGLRCGTPPARIGRPGR